MTQESSDRPVQDKRATATSRVASLTLTPAAQEALRERQAAEAAALRANLLRRKAQARARAEPAPARDAGPADPIASSQPLSPPSPETDPCR